MASTIDIIRSVCREKGTSIAQLEKRLGYSNGSLVKSPSIPFGRIIEIADYFGLPTDYFVPKNEGEGVLPELKNYYIDKQANDLAQKMYENPELRALFDAADGVPKNVLVSVYNLLMSMKQNEKGEN